MAAALGGIGQTAVEWVNGYLGEDDDEEEEDAAGIDVKESLKSLLPW